MMTAEQFVNMVMAEGCGLVNREDTLNLCRVMGQSGKFGIAFIINDPVAHTDDTSLFQAFDDCMENAKPELFDPLETCAGYRLDWEALDNGTVRVMVYFPAALALASVVSDLCERVSDLNLKLQHEFAIVQCA